MSNSTWGLALANLKAPPAVDPFKQSLRFCPRCNKRVPESEFYRSPDGKWNWVCRTHMRKYLNDRRRNLLTR